MKNIELTEDHKSKLLEMCKILFPEYYWSFDKCESKEYDIEIDNILTGTVQGKSEMDQTSEIVIHWFEFCMTWLSHKIIFNPNNKLSACNHNHAGLLESTMSIFYGEKHRIHPIDYLYEEFKKLK